MRSVQAQEPVIGLPPPSATLVLIRTGVQALMRTLGRRKAERLLREWSAILVNLETVQTLLPSRSPADRAEVAKAQMEAVAWWREILPALLDSIPKD